VRDEESWPPTPNPRLQRTPAAAPPSPLSRKPFGVRKGIALASATLAIACSARPNLEMRIQQLAGPQAVDCGHVAFGADRTRSGSCLLAAIEAGRPLWVRYDRQGIDSHIETVLVRTLGGPFVRLEYDSDIRGSGSTFWAKPKLSEYPCSGRLVREAAKPPEIACE
jgi:hypothetical protein